MTRILLTGFEPFVGATVNASWQAVSRAQELWEGPEELVTRQLPVVFDRAGELLTELIDEHCPDLIVAIGEARGRTAVTPERVAVNVADARIPDNSGPRPRASPCSPAGRAPTQVGFLSTTASPH